MASAKSFFLGLCRNRRNIIFLPKYKEPLLLAAPSKDLSKKVSGFWHALLNPSDFSAQEKVLLNPNLSNNPGGISCLEIRQQDITFFFESANQEGPNSYKEIAGRVIEAQRKKRDGEPLTHVDESFVNFKVENLTYCGGGARVYIDRNDFIKRIIEAGRKGIDSQDSILDVVSSLTDGKER